MNPGQPLITLIIAVCILILGVILVRDFRHFRLQVKIILGIMLTGGITLGFIAYFAIESTAAVTNSLSQQLDHNVRSLAEEQLISTAKIQADQINQFFTETKKDVETLAEYRVSIQSQKATLSQGSYWDAATHLSRLSGGQFANSSTEISSVFMPAGSALDNQAITELNTSAYLDFSAPQFLKASPSTLAIYYINPKGIVRYYPNVDLAAVLPPDFDATSRSYYTIATPLFNPQKLTRWAIPYVDATGGGLVVTVSTPVYFGNQFNGVMAADIQLSLITKQVTAIKVGQTGYAFMIDNAGRIISMPSGGYKIFGINPSELNPDEFFKQTVLGKGPADINALTSRMVAGGTGLNIVPVNGVDTYFSFAPVQANGYSLVLVVPVAEMQTAITAARNDTQARINSTIRLAALILTGMFIFAIIISIIIGQIISSPVIRLTQTANQIVEGDTSAQAVVDSKDEIGTLARAFNTMTTRLRGTLEGLEQRVKERTVELESAQQQTLLRASQLQAVTELSETIAQFQDLNELFPAITELIHERFGFYHVGIFLVDKNSETTVLQAANSEGGKHMLARGHRLKLGIGVVGFAAQAGQPRIALDVGTDAVFFNNPDLPTTRSEAALPLRGHNETFGVLDVQSEEANAFSEENLQVLTALANQVAIAIENARLLTEARAALAQVQEIYNEFTRAEWSRAIGKEEQKGFRYKSGHIEQMENEIKLPEVVSALETGDVIEILPEDSNEMPAAVIVPVKLRGEVIGILHVESSELDRSLTIDEITLIEAAAERAAFALENARLFQDARRRASKEQLISEATARISNALSIENILQTTAQELERALGGSEVLIQFQNKEQ